jgi:hypothetical protein
MMIAQRLNSLLPEEYIAQPSVRLGDMLEIDIAALERESGRGSFSRVDDEGSLMVASWAPADPNILLDTEFPEPSLRGFHGPVRPRGCLRGNLPVASDSLTRNRLCHSTAGGMRF